jgi:hypothetical protein
MKSREINLETNKKVMSYMNLNKKVTELCKMGLLEEIKPDLSTINTSGLFRRDYKATLKGLKHLIPHFMAHREEINGLNKYMDEFKLDKQALGASLAQDYAFRTLAFNEYLKYIEIPEVIPLGVKNAMTEIVNRMEQTEKKHPKIKKVLIEEMIEVSDSVTSKAAHAIHVSSDSSKMTRKKN